MAAALENPYDIPLELLDEKTIIFGKPIEGKFNEVSYVRIPIFRQNSAGKQVPLIIHGPHDPHDDSPSTWLFSPGLKAFEDKEKRGKVTHSMMVLLYALGGATEYQEKWVKEFKEKVQKKCATYCITNAAKIGKPGLKNSGLKSDYFGETFDHIKYPKKKDAEGKDTDEVDEKSSPSLSIKMIESQARPDEGKEGRILNEFLKYDADIIARIENGDPNAELEAISPYVLINQKTKMKVKFELKIESIFVGKTTLSIQIKLHKACIAPMESKMRRVMRFGPQKREEEKEVVEKEEEIHIPEEEDT
jgi:hypothetical protein